MRSIEDIRNISNVALASIRQIGKYLSVSKSCNL